MNFPAASCGELDPQRLNLSPAIMSLAEYGSSGRTKENDNGMVRKISGEGARTAYGGCTGDMLKRAMDNIEKHFSVVGLQERFDDTLKLLQRIFHWPDIPYENQNITKNKLDRSLLPRQTISIIEEQNALDRELYEFVRKRFMEKMRESTPLGSEKVAITGIKQPRILFNSNMKKERVMNSDDDMMYQEPKLVPLSEAMSGATDCGGGSNADGLCALGSVAGLPGCSNGTVPSG